MQIWSTTVRYMCTAAIPLLSCPYSVINHEFVTLFDCSLLTLYLLVLCELTPLDCVCLNEEGHSETTSVIGSVFSDLEYVNTCHSV